MRTRLSIAILFVQVLWLVGAHAGTLESLMPYPRSAYYTDSTITLNSLQRVYVAPDKDTSRFKIGPRLQKLALRMSGAPMPESDISEYRNQAASIVFGTVNAMAKFTAPYKPMGEIAPPHGGYTIDITADKILVSYPDEHGAHSAMSTLEQLIDGASSLRTCHVFDFPDYPVRWVFSTHNLQVNQNIEQVKAIADTMARYKLNGIQVSDFKLGVLDRVAPWYRQNVKSLKDHLAERLIEPVPAVANFGWSSTILYRDQNVAEGILARQKFVFRGDTAHIVGPQSAVIPNGGFEQIGSNGRFTGFSFYDDSFSPDSSVQRTGRFSARAENFRGGNSAGNARVARTIACLPSSYYRMTAWVRTNGIKGGFFQLLALGAMPDGTSRPLTFTELDVPATTVGWRKVSVLFNTLSATQVTLYVGLWGGNEGQFWVDDWTVEPASLSNVLRRAQTPVSLTLSTLDVEPIEGKDFALEETLTDNRYGNFDAAHPPLRLRRLENTVIPAGDTVEVAFYHPFVAVSNSNGEGSVMACPSHEGTYDIVRQQIREVDTLFEPMTYFMQHDEIRSMNWDLECQESNLSPASILANNLTRCSRMIDSIRPGMFKYVWSDMFDSLHNARDNYYLVNGDLRGVWEQIPKSIRIANWNNGRARESLDFFFRKGFRQITTPYYDVGNSSSIRQSRLAMQDIDGVEGMMYTTWQGDYSQLRPFAYYSWLAGPSIMHRPLDSTAFAMSTTVRAHVRPDPFDASDSIAEVRMVMTRSNKSSAIRRFDLQRTGLNTYTTVQDFSDLDWFRYYLLSRNAQGLFRVSSHYEVRRSGTVSTGEGNETESALRLWPNPAQDVARVELPGSCGPVKLTITDCLGSTVRNVTVENYQDVVIVTKDLGTGVFVVRATSPCTTHIGKFFVQ